MNASDSLGKLRDIPVDMIRRGRYQPRLQFTAKTIEELAKSLSQDGVVQPIVVRPVGATFEIIAGERRWRAAQVAGLHSVPAVVREVDDLQAARMSLVENVQREPLTPIEEARAYQRLQKEFGMQHEEIAAEVGKSRPVISNKIRLLSLDARVQEMLEDGRIEEGAARPLLSLPPAAQFELATLSCRDNLSVREIEKRVKLRLQLQGKPSKGTPAETRDPNVCRLEKRLSEHFGTTVKIEYRETGGGVLKLAYHNLDALEGLLERMRVEKE